MNYHVPVLIDEVMGGLLVQPGKRYIDATYGGGGYTKEIVKNGGTVLGIDTDPDAIGQTLPDTTGKVRIAQGNFRDIEEIGKTYGFTGIEGIVFDLGVSSHQLDTKDRGFSYRFDDAPLDMRFSKTGRSAREIVNSLSEQELKEIFLTYGEEGTAGEIAREIVHSRSAKPLRTTKDLFLIIERVNRGKQTFNVASKIFQALRIAVNDELDALSEGLKGAEHLLQKGGRLVVVSFHSLEDRIVKRTMKNNSWQMLTKDPITAGQRERSENSRSRSAKLRIAEKI